LVYACWPELSLERALIAAPDDARVRRDLGSAYVRAGRAADGARSLRTAIAKDPGALDTWVLLGHALAAAGDRDEAMVALDVAARLGVADRPALDLLADLQLDANEPAGAAATYEAALAAARPRDPETLERLAVARLRSGDAARALAALDEVLSLDATAGRPPRSSALLWRSDALAALGRASEARALLEALVRECGRAGGRESDRVREAARERLARLR
jgi:tetratricopeptide (TPR) repeat protein